jgi:hypothetical protein
MKESVNCKLAEGFSIWEKLHAQVSFFAMGILGTIGIFYTDWVWVIPYVLIYWYGIPGIVQRHITCPRCDHLYKYGDCLQLPPALSKWFVKKRKTNPLSRSEKILFLSIFILIPTYPIYWLLPQKILLSAFILSAAMWYLAQLFYFCKRCRVRNCPFNRVKNWD